MATSNEKPKKQIEGPGRRFLGFLGAVAASLSLSFCTTSSFLQITERAPEKIIEESFKRDMGKLGTIPLLGPETEPMRLVIDLPEVRDATRSGTTTHHTYYAMPAIDFQRVADDPKTQVRSNTTAGERLEDPDTKGKPGSSLDDYNFIANLQPDDLTIRGLTGEEIGDEAGEDCIDNPDEQLCSVAINFNSNNQLRDLAQAAVAACLGDAVHTTGATVGVAKAIQYRQRQMFTDRVVNWLPVKLPRSVVDNPSLSGLTCSIEVV